MQTKRNPALRRGFFFQIRSWDAAPEEAQNNLALARLEAAVGLVDDENTSPATNNLAIPMTLFQRLE